ncbi:MAG: pantoate--beta-alanine ligase [Bacteroidetes bacterium]|nr:pantoate--beta-alanine ligase [Bacteroidota bacterium]
MREYLERAKLMGLSIGFVPTMGALHPGHMSLIERAKRENDLVVSSIFVNPTQFGDAKDLLNYPRTPDADYELLKQHGCDMVFTPSVAEMYPDQSLIEMKFGDLEKVMEGAYRPGHFKGVATIVSRFFEIIRPNRAYFGQKDFQQLAIIKEMNEQLKTGIEIVGCATMREPDGLAMSSRNIHLSFEERKAAPVIYNSLLLASELVRINEPEEVKHTIIKIIEALGGFKVQYLEFVDSLTLKPITKWQSHADQRACIAVITSKTRLIDNVAI